MPRFKFAGDEGAGIFEIKRAGLYDDAEIELGGDPFYRTCGNGVRAVPVEHTALQGSVVAYEFKAGLCI